MKNIQMHFENQLCWLTLSRPDALNALNMQTLDELQEALRTVAKEKPRALVITGAGEKAFVAGADIKEIHHLHAQSALDFCELGQSVFTSLEKLAMPVVAMVNGFALGGGLELALACDFIYASNNAKFGLPEVTLGLIPGFGGTQRLARAIGPMRARELIYTGRLLSAPEALQWGLVNAVTEPQELRSKVNELLQLRGGPMAIGAAKEVIGRGLDGDLGHGLTLERERFAGLFATDEPREGTKAFMEKRPSPFIKH